MIVIIGFALLIIPLSVSTTENQKLDTKLTIELSAINQTNNPLISRYPKTTEILLYRVVRNVKNFFIQNDENNFTGRCIQLAKKIRTLIPYAIFATGVIITLLGFLTMFSIKSLGLLVLLLLINTSTAVAKITAAFAHKSDKKPSTVHYHVSKYDDHHIGHTGYGHDWDRKTKINEEIMELDRMESYNLYNKLLNNLAAKNYQI